MMWCRTLSYQVFSMSVQTKKGFNVQASSDHEFYRKTYKLMFSMPENQIRHFWMDPPVLYQTTMHTITPNLPSVTPSRLTHSSAEHHFSLPTTIYYPTIQRRHILSSTRLYTPIPSNYISIRVQTAFHAQKIIQSEKMPILALPNALTNKTHREHTLK